MRRAPKSISNAAKPASPASFTFPENKPNDLKNSNLNNIEKADYSQIAVYYDQEFYAIDKIADEIEESSELLNERQKFLEETKVFLDSKLKEFAPLKEGAEHPVTKYKRLSPKSFNALSSYIENGKTDDSRFNFGNSKDPNSSLKSVSEKIDTVQGFINSNSSSNETKNRTIFSKAQTAKKLTFTNWKQNLDEINSQIELLQFMLSVAEGNLPED